MVADNDPAGTIFKIKRFSIHDGPGIRTAVFMKGCPLQCIWCHSPEGIGTDITVWHDQSLCIFCSECIKACPENAVELSPVPKPLISINRNLCKNSGNCAEVCPSNAMQFTGYVKRVSEILDEILKDKLFYDTSEGGVTLTGGEPLFQPGFSEALLKACNLNDIHTSVETSLFCDKEAIEKILDYVDLFIIDLKILDSDKHKYYTGKPNEIIKDNFRYIAFAGKPIIVRIPLVANLTDNQDNKDSIMRFIHEIDETIPVEFIIFNTLARNNYDKLGISYLLT